TGLMPRRSKYIAVHAPAGPPPRIITGRFLWGICPREFTRFLQNCRDEDVFSGHFRQAYFTLFDVTTPTHSQTWERDASRQSPIVASSLERIRAQPTIRMSAEAAGYSNKKPASPRRSPSGENATAKTFELSSVPPGNVWSSAPSETGLA